MADTVEVLGNESALAHHFGTRDIQVGIVEGYQNLINQIGSETQPGDIPIAISYGTDFSNYPREESDTVFALLSRKRPLFKSVVTTEEIELPGQPSEKERITTRTLLLVAPKILTMSGALFTPNSTISDIEAVNSFTLGRTEDAQSEFSEVSSNIYDADVFMYDHTVAVGLEAIVQKLVDRFLYEITESNLSTALACREIFVRCGLTQQMQDLSGRLSRVINDAVNFADSIKRLKQE